MLYLSALLAAILSVFPPVANRCPLVGATEPEQWQIFLNVDGNNLNNYNGYEYVVRGVEKADANHYSIRSTIDTGVCCAGGWGPTVGFAEISETATEFRVAIPSILLGSVPKLLLETYSAAGVRLTATVVQTGTTGCAQACPLGDFDGDCDVDLQDFAIFQDSFQ